MADHRSDDDARLAAATRRAAGPALPKRFYAAAGVREHPEGFAVVLDDKPMRTPGRRELAVPRRALAEAIASEWSAQGEFIDPATLPVTRLVNSAIDGVKGREAEVAADAAKYAGSDLVCYRADFPEGLVARQAEHWDPVLAWAAGRGWPLVSSVGVMHVVQPASALEGVASAVGRHGAFVLAGLHSMTTLMGSVLLALAVVEGRLDAAAAWKAAHVDEDWQISQWGEDAEAARRRAYRWREMQAAALLAATSR